MTGARGTHQLPRGRHGLTREEVLASQRGRMLEAMAQVVAEDGYAAATVAKVIRRAGVSRETFYEQFSDKEDCFLAALDGVTDIMVGRLVEALDADGGQAGGAAGGDPLDRLDAIFGVYLSLMASERALARTFMLEVYGAGVAAQQRRVEVMRRFVDLVLGVVGAEDEERRFACEALIAAVSSMVTMRIAADDLASLPALREPVGRLARRLLGD